MPFYEGTRPVVGRVELAGKFFERSLVVTHKKPYIEKEGQMIMVEFWEIIDDHRKGNLGFVHIGDEWIQGRTNMRTWKGEGGIIERQNMFTSDDNKIKFVVTSEPITV